MDVGNYGWFRGGWTRDPAQPAKLKQQLMTTVCKWNAGVFVCNLAALGLCRQQNLCRPCVLGQRMWCNHHIVFVCFGRVRQGRRIEEGAGQPVVDLREARSGLWKRTRLDRDHKRIRE